MNKTGLSNTSLPQNEALKKRYGEVNSPTEGPWNDVVGAILSHRSVRSYKTRKITRFHFRDINGRGSICCN